MEPLISSLQILQNLGSLSRATDNGYVEIGDESDPRNMMLANNWSFMAEIRVHQKLSPSILLLIGVCINTGTE